MGLSLAGKLVTAGATVIVLDIAPRPRNIHKSIRYFQLDVANFAALEKMKRELDSEKLYPSVIVNNAGIHNGGKYFTETSPELIER